MLFNGEVKLLTIPSLDMLITYQIIQFFTFISSREFVFLSVINNRLYFGSKKCYLFQAGSFYKKVLY